jgi:hypothetical protein
VEYFSGETTPDAFRDNLMSVVRNDFPGHPTGTVSYSRNNKLDILITVCHQGYIDTDKLGYRPGTLRQATETLSLQSPGGITGIARGVISLGHTYQHSTVPAKGGQGEFSYSAQSVELDYNTGKEACFTIEWVANLSDDFIWTGFTRTEVQESFSEKLDVNGSCLELHDQSSRSGGRKSQRLIVGGVELFFLNGQAKSDVSRIIYRGCPSEEIRNRIRGCISFIFGLPVVHLGSTNYSEKWDIVSCKSIDGFSIDGLVLNLQPQPPYPIFSAYYNVLDAEMFSNAVNNLYNSYDRLNLSRILWQYWYAVCSPMQSSAVHYGGLIENLQRMLNMSAKDGGRILPKEQWFVIQKVFAKHLEDAGITGAELKLLTGKISSLNQASPSLALSRTLSSMGMSISDLEDGAWKHRNYAAHGMFSPDFQDIILNSKLLKTLFHRLIAGATYCSDTYIDYYSLGHPVRKITESISKPYEET